MSCSGDIFTDSNSVTVELDYYADDFCNSGKVPIVSDAECVVPVETPTLPLDVSASETSVPTALPTEEIMICVDENSSLESLGKYLVSKADIFADAVGNLKCVLTEDGGPSSVGADFYSLHAQLDHGFSLTLSLLMNIVVTFK